MSRAKAVLAAIALILVVGLGKPAKVIRHPPGLTYHIDSLYSTGTAIVPRMYGTASLDSVPGRYRYTYTLVNERSSKNTIWEFALDPVPRPLSVTPPLHWRWAYGWDTEDSALAFMSEADDRPAPRGWDSLTIVRSLYDLAPGDSFTFGFVSDRSPSTTHFFAQGYYQDSISNEETGPYYFPVSIWNNGVEGTVIGPGATRVPTSQGRHRRP